MSRSFRKVCTPICSSYGDKWCRSQYHRSFRRKTKKLLKECMSFHDLWSGEVKTTAYIMLINGLGLLMVVRIGAKINCLFIKHLIKKYYVNPQIFGMIILAIVTAN